jgi:hypothetical protein
VTLEQAVVVGAAAALAAMALVAASATWRMLGRTGSGLRELDERLLARTETLPKRAATARERLVNVRGETERALWTLANLDARVETARAALADKHAASDRLRASMKRNRAPLERIRNGARALLRVVQMRREFLG